MKKLLFILLVFVGCEHPDYYECKDCTYFENGQPVTVFVCGDQLQKFENDGYYCVNNSKDGR